MEDDGDDGDGATRGERGCGGEAATTVTRLFSLVQSF
jgi:hypothetical protein